MVLQGGVESDPFSIIRKKPRARDRKPAAFPRTVLYLLALA